MQTFSLPRSIPRRWLVACTLLALGGCASVGTSGGDPSRPDGASATGDVAAAGAYAPMDAPTASANNPAAARNVLPGTNTSSAAIGSIVVTNPLAPRTVDLTQRPDDIWVRIRTGFAIPNLDTPLVAQQQAWYLSHPESLRRAVVRSGLYLFHVVEELNKRGMPTEIALLPFVESSYNPMAYSPAHASGMWQFIPGTGKTYNLKQDWWRDERRDVLASTDAALEYLQTVLPPELRDAIWPLLGEENALYSVRPARDVLNDLTRALDRSEPNLVVARETAQKTAKPRPAPPS